MKSTLHNVVSISGGKDSTATLLLAIVQEVPNLSAVFADTGHEHPMTYDYVRYLEKQTGIPIQWVSRDFTKDIEIKRQSVQKKWRSDGVPEVKIERALAVLHPTGIPFLDMCLVAGRFPSSLGKFCTRQLKVEPIIEQVFLPLMEAGDAVWSWQGVRAEESFARRHLPEFEEVGGGMFNYRPLIRWTWEDVFEAHQIMGIKPNPLYLEGMSRVGCMPCIHATKDDIMNIAQRFPEEIERVVEWERIVEEATKGTSHATFFNHGDDGGTPIKVAVDWSKTSRGGKQYDMFRVDTGERQCSSAYGLCG